MPATVLAALETMRDRLPITAQAIRQGLARVDLPGRFQVLPGQPAIVLDVGHNPQAAAHLARNLDEHGLLPADLGGLRHAWRQGRRRPSSRQYVRVVDHWICCDLPGPRGLAGEALARIVGDLIDADGTGAGHAVTVAVAPTPGEALRQALSAGQATDRIVVFGSFLTVADVQRTLAAATTGNAPSS